MYSGYLEDNRITDQSWEETTLLNYHDEGGIIDSLSLKSGKDAYEKVSWVPLHKNMSPALGHQPLILPVCFCVFISLEYNDVTRYFYKGCGIL